MKACANTSPCAKEDSSMRPARISDVLQQLSFFERCEDFISLVAHALMRAASTLVSTPVGCISHCLRLRRAVGQTPWSARDALVPPPEQRYHSSCKAPAGQRGRRPQSSGLRDPPQRTVSVSERPSRPSQNRER